jgi:hypothetical protein
MADQGTLGLARAEEKPGDEPSKEELQRRMDEARDSITHTVTEIKDTVVHQYEAVKETIAETLDWREQVKKRPVAWSAGAAGAGFLVGYGIAALVKGAEGSDDSDYVRSLPPGYGARPLTSQGVLPTSEGESNEQSGPGMLGRFTETAAFERLRHEAASIGNQFVDELSDTAKQILLPAAIGWIRGWLEELIPEKKGSIASRVETTPPPNRPSSYQPVLERK